MQSIAVLLTCFNRKDKTLSALKCLYQAYESVAESISLAIYLTDDGSTDGTSEAVKESYPEANILPGTGELFWAGGMRNSWNAALNKDYDGYLLLNDDTDVIENLFVELLETDKYCSKKYGQTGIYVGSTQHAVTKKISYGGSVFTNRFLARYIKLKPNKTSPQECELGNANIMLVHEDVVQKIGILSDKYIHGLADFDYTLMAVKNKIPVLITPNFLGVCNNDNFNPYSNFHELKLSERIKTLYHPIGLDFKSNLQYMKRNFPFRLPFVFLAGWFKVIFPRLYKLRFRAV